MPADDKQPRIRARMTNDYVDYLHNDLSNAAWFFRERINKGFEEEARADGLFLEMMAAVTMIAFSLEGYANFLGDRLLGSGFNERDTVVEKLKAVRKAVGIEVDWNGRPYATARELVRLRNMLAHPKPQRAEPREWEAVGTDGELRKMLRDHKPEFERLLTRDFMNAAYEDVEAIWQQLLAAAKIDAHETWSGGAQGFELIEHVPVDTP